MEEYFFKNPNQWIIICSLFLMIISIKDYKNKKYKNLFIDLIIICLIKYVFSLLFRGFGFIKMFLLNYSQGMSQNFIYSIILVDLIALVGGTIAYKYKKHKLVLFFIFLSIFYQYINIFNYI